MHSYTLHIESNGRKGSRVIEAAQVAIRDGMVVFVDDDGVAIEMVAASMVTAVERTPPDAEPGSEQQHDEPMPGAMPDEQHLDLLACALVINLGDSVREHAAVELTPDEDALVNVSTSRLRERLRLPKPKEPTDG